MKIGTEVHASFKIKFLGHYMKNKPNEPNKPSFQTDLNI